MTQPRIEVRRASERYATPTGWGRSLHSFSFGPAYDPANVSHGALMVNNEELVESGTGFDDHPHADAEIITWILAGSLVHTDSRGGTGLVHPGLVQRLSAGSGVVHAERNDAYRIDPARRAEPVHFVQMWVRPDSSGLSPSYQQGSLDLGELVRDWLPVASGSHPDAAVTLESAGSTLWVSTVPPGQMRELPTAPFVHLYVARGDLVCESAGPLSAGDSVRISGHAALRLSGGREPAEVLVWEMAR